MKSNFGPSKTLCWIFPSFDNNHYINWACVLYADLFIAFMCFQSSWKKNKALGPKHVGIECYITQSSGNIWNFSLSTPVLHNVYKLICICIIWEYISTLSLLCNLFLFRYIFLPSGSKTWVAFYLELLLFPWSVEFYFHSWGISGLYLFIQLIIKH